MVAVGATPIIANTDGVALGTTTRLTLRTATVRVICTTTGTVVLTTHRWATPLSVTATRFLVSMAVGARIAAKVRATTLSVRLKT